MHEFLDILQMVRQTVSLNKMSYKQVQIVTIVLQDESEQK